MTCYRDGQRDGNRNRKNRNQRIESKNRIERMTNIIYERICEILKNSTKKMMIQYSRYVRMHVRNPVYSLNGKQKIEWNAYQKPK